MVLKDRLDSLGYEVIVARDGMQALEAVERETPRLMVLDLEMPRLSGIEVLQRLSQGKQRGRDGYDVPVIVMTAHGTIKKAVEAMREGAYDFVTKPIEVEHLIITIQKASERETLKRHYEVLRSELGTKYATIIGNSLQMKSMIELAQRAANSDAGVLLLRRKRNRQGTFCALDSPVEPAPDGAVRRHQLRRADGNVAGE